MLVVDDHPMFVKALTTLLGPDDSIEIVGTASDGNEAIALTLDLQPDVVLMDLHMPEMGGLEATRELAVAAPHVAIVVLTMFDDDDSLVAALSSGAQGYLLKGARRGEVVRAITAAHAGETILSSQVAKRLAGLVGNNRLQPADDHRNTARAFPELTEREVEVLALMAAGLGNASIAQRLFLSDKTVRNYVSLVLAKMHADTRSEAIVRARESGLGW